MCAWHRLRGLARPLVARSPHAGTSRLHILAGSTCNAKTIPEAIAEFSRTHSSDSGLIAAGPPVIVALLSQRFIVGGLTSGAVKG